jgi:hypothetical protein
MYYIKRFNETHETKEYNTLDVVFNWIKKEYSSNNCIIQKIKDGNEEVVINIDCSSPASSNGFTDRTFVKLKIKISDYVHDYDYSVSIKGKSGEFMKGDNKSWREFEKISNSARELSLAELKAFIRKAIDKFLY